MVLCRALSLITRLWRSERRDPRSALRYCRALCAYRILRAGTNKQQVDAAGGDKKLFGRHFDYGDEIVSFVSLWETDTCPAVRSLTKAVCLLQQLTRESIDCLKNYFKDDMSKDDWKLVIKLKKVFEIF